jgi:4,5-dihydroxyphthalate decarboxylase
MSALRLTYKGSRYLDRSVALETGDVVPEGIDLDVVPVPSLGGLLDQLTAGETDVAELLLGEFVVHVAGGGDDVVGLPVFPSRRFAQRWLWVAQDSRITELAELEGRRIGFPGRAHGGIAWVIALLRATAGLDLADVELVRGRMGGGLERILDTPPEPEDPTPLVDRLRAGDIDCLLSPYPVPAQDGGDRMRLLLPNPGEHERAYVRAGRGVPLQTIVAMRRDLYEADRWIAWSLTDAFAQAKALGAERLNYLGALGVALPWLSTQLEEIDELFGGDAFPYGLERSRGALQVYLDLAVATGLIEQAPAVDELFAPEVLMHPGIPDTTAYDVPMRGTRQGGAR